MTEKTNTTIGVGFLLFFGGKLLTVEEQENKPELQKKAGMISFPLETFDQKKDKNLLDTVIRLLKEELGVQSYEVLISGIHKKIFDNIHNGKDVVVYYGMGIFLGDPERAFIPGDNDIRVVGWKTPLELMKTRPIRIEVEPILTHYITQSRKNFSLEFAKQTLST